jgi:hypothetical protein
MNLQLKTNEIFIHPENGIEFNTLFGGMKNMNFSVKDWSLNFKIEFYVSETLMNEGKKEVYSQTFSIRNDGEIENELFMVLLQAPSGSTIRDVIENAVYNYVINQEGFTIFEII